MAKLSLTDVTATQNQTSLAATINANHTKLETALEKTLSRDGTSPNAMEADLDMNSMRIFNLPDAESNSEPFTYGQAQEILNLVDDFNESIGTVADYAASALASKLSAEEEAAAATLAKTGAEAAQLAAEIAAAGAGVTDGDKTDITVSSAGTVWTVDDTVPETKRFTPSGAGAVNRTIQAKLRDALTILDYGGSLVFGTDNTAACQAMLDAVGYVAFPAGSFVMNGLVTWTNKTVEIFGAGKTITKVYLRTASAAGFSGTNTNTEVNHAERFSAHDLTFYTNQAGVHTPLHCTWNSLRLVTGRWYDIHDINWMVEDELSADQRFANIIWLKNAMGGSITSFSVRGRQQGSEGNGILLDGISIGHVIEDYQVEYGNVFVSLGNLELIRVYYTGISGGSAFGGYKLVTGATSGATGRWSSQPSGSSVYLSPESGVFQVGETISDGTVSATITGIAASAGMGEGVHLGAGEVVGYVTRFKSVGPRWAHGWSITSRISGHSNCTGIDIDVSMMRGLYVNTEILAPLSSASRIINVDSVEDLSISAMFNIAGSGQSCIALADIYNGVVYGSICEAGHANFINFLNSNVFDFAITGNVSKASPLVTGAYTQYRPGVSNTLATSTVTAASVVSGGSGYSVGDYIVDGSNYGKGPNGYSVFVLRVESVTAGAVTAVSIVQGGNYTFQTPNGYATRRPSGYGGSGATFNLTWGSGAGVTGLHGVKMTGNVASSGDTSEYYGEITWDAPSVAANSSGAVYADVAITGVAYGDFVQVSTSADIGNISLRPVAQTNNVRINFDNRTASAIDPASMTYYVKVMKR